MDAVDFVSIERTEANPAARHIARVAARLFASQGFDATPVRSIVEAAGVTKPTLYYHFGSKEGLARALLTVPMTGLVNTLEMIVDAGGDPVGMLERTFEAHFVFCREEPDRARFFFALVFGPHGSGALAEELFRFGEAMDAPDERHGPAAFGGSGHRGGAGRGFRPGLLRNDPDGGHGFPLQGRRPGCGPGASPSGRPALGIRYSGACRGSGVLTMMLRLRAVVSAGLIAAPGLAGCGGHAAEKPVVLNVVPRAVMVTVAATERKEVERTVEVVGSLRGWEQVTLGIKKEGRVRKVFHDMGDRVKPGEPLIEMETDDADLAVRQAERRLQVELAKLGLKDLPEKEFDVSSLPSVLQARAALDKAKRLYERERSLVQRNAGAMQDFQNAESDERAADAALANAIMTSQSTLANAQSARVALEIAQHDRKEMEIRAPVPTHAPAGVTGAVFYAISKRSVSEGQMLRVGDPVMELVIDKPLRLWANVPERFSADVKLGQSVRVSVSTYPGTPFDGDVVRINPTVELASRTFQVEAIVPNKPRPAPPRRIRQGVDPDRPPRRGHCGPGRFDRRVRRRDQAVPGRERQGPRGLRREGARRVGLGRGDRPGPRRCHGGRHRSDPACRGDAGRDSRGRPGQEQGVEGSGAIPVDDGPNVTLRRFCPSHFPVPAVPISGPQSPQGRAVPSRD